MMYAKNGTTCDCKVVYDEENDLWISNPTEEQLLSLGWEPVVPREEITEEEQTIEEPEI